MNVLYSVDDMCSQGPRRPRCAELCEAPGKVSIMHEWPTVSL